MGWFKKAVGTVKKVASSPIVRMAAKAAAPLLGKVVKNIPGANIAISAATQLIKLKSGTKTAAPVVSGLIEGFRPVEAAMPMNLPGIGTVGGLIPGVVGGLLPEAVGAVGRAFSGRRRRRRRRTGLDTREIGQLLMMKSILGARHPATVYYGIRAVSGRM